jgi:hypothetical protein
MTRCCILVGTSKPFRGSVGPGMSSGGFGLCRMSIAAARQLGSEMWRTPWSVAGRNKPARTWSEKAVGVVRNDKDGRSECTWRCACRRECACVFLGQDDQCLMSTEGDSRQPHERSLVERLAERGHLFFGAGCVREASQEIRPHEPVCVFVGEAKGMRRESEVLGPETPWNGKSHVAIVDACIHAQGRDGRAAKTNELQPGLRLEPSLVAPPLRGGRGEAERTSHPEAPVNFTGGRSGRSRS